MELFDSVVRDLRYKQEQQERREVDLAIERRRRAYEIEKRRKEEAENASPQEPSQVKKTSQ